MMVEKALQARPIKETLGREVFPSARTETEEWRNYYRATQKLGASCDWSRESYTMNKKPKAVRHLFVDLYKRSYLPGEVS